MPNKPEVKKAPAICEYLVACKAQREAKENKERKTTEG
jgi:hypothetical protein